MIRKPDARKKQPKDGEAGQATIEFALTLILLLSFTLFYLQLSMVLAWGNFVHYATFMSARAYMAAGPDRSDQVERAKNVIIRLTKRSPSMQGTDRFPGIARAVGGGDVPGWEVDPPAQFEPFTRASSWMEGVRYTFRGRLFLIPLGRSAPSGSSAPRGPASANVSKGDVNGVTLTSESWLGREPTTEDCTTNMKGKLGIFDNGC